MMRTYTGQIIDPQNPKPENISLADIAWALAHTPRYNGHYPRFLSLSEHSINVAKAVMAKSNDSRAVRTALLQHAHAAYSNLDMDREPLQKALADRFDLYYRLPEVVIQANLAISEAESALWTCLPTSVRLLGADSGHMAAEACEYLRYCKLCGLL